MAYFKISEPNKPTKWIKDIDRANCKLEFSEDRSGCFQQDSGFFADSELSYLKFHFTEDYPEMQYCEVDSDYYPRHSNVAVQAEPVAEGEMGGVAADIPW